MFISNINLCFCLLRQIIMILFIRMKSTFVSQRKVRHEACLCACTHYNNRACYFFVFFMPYTNSAEAFRFTFVRPSVLKEIVPKVEKWGHPCSMDTFLFFLNDTKYFSHIIHYIYKKQTIVYKVVVKEDFFCILCNHTNIARKQV